MRLLAYIALWLVTAVTYVITGSDQAHVAMWASVILFHIVAMDERAKRTKP